MHRILVSTIIFSYLIHVENFCWSQEFNINIHSNRYNFSDFIDHVEIVPLEETENSLLPKVQYYFKTPEGIGIINKKTSRIILFDKNGNYKAYIDRHGQGPEEYKSLSTAWIEDEIICLYSDQSRSVLSFDLKGRFLAVKQLGFPKEIWGGNLIRYLDGYVQQMLDPAPSKKVTNELMFLDSKFRLISYGAPNKNPHHFKVNLGNRFQELGNEIVWKKAISDSIFILDNYQLRPFMKFNFGEDWAWSNPIASTNMKTAYNTIWKENTKVWEVLSKVGERFVLLTYKFTVLEDGKGLIDRETGKFYRFDMRKNNGEDYGLYFLEWEGDRLISSLQAYDVEDFLQNLDERQYSIAGGLKYEDFKYSENPVLLKIKFKIPD